MTTQAFTSGDAAAPIRRKLAALRRAVRLWLCIDGLAVLAVAAVLLAVLSLAVDRTMRMDVSQRALSLALGLGVLGFLAYRQLVRPLARRLDDEALGLIVESRCAQLGQRLISALEFSRLADPEALGCSAAMVRASIDQGLRAAAAVDMPGTLDRRRRRRRLAAGLAAAAVFAGAFALLPGTMLLWLERNILLGDRAWPQATHLEVLDAADGVIVCPRGDDLAVRVRADPAGVIPSLVMLEYRQDGGAAGAEPMALVGSDLFSTVFRSVLAPLRFRAWGGDAETPWHDVRLVERPAIESLDLVSTPPPYVGKGPQPLAAQGGAGLVLAGSTVEVRGRASKDLHRAELAFDKGRPEDIQLTGPREFRAALAGDRLRSGTYAVQVTDAESLAMRRPACFVLRVVPDEKPVVRAALVGIGDLIAPRATVPVQARMSDDYAVASADLVYAAAAEGAKEPVRARAPFGERKDIYGYKQAAAVHRLQVEPLRLSAGSHLVLHVEACDNDAVSGPKAGVSGSFSLRVVTEGELQADLLRREQESRMEFERLLRDQQKLLENSRALAAGLRQAGAAGLAAQDRAMLAASEKQQRLVGGRALAIAQEFARIMAEVENNRLEEDMRPVRDRLQNGIIGPLHEVGRRGVPQAADLLDVARKSLPDAAAAAGPPAAGSGADAGRQGGAPAALAALADAAAEQERLVAAMREVLKHMVKWEGYQEAVNLLRDVLKAQKNVSDETFKEYQRRIQKIFEP